jgi:hypothetical protein
MCNRTDVDSCGISLGDYLREDGHPRKQRNRRSLENQGEIDAWLFFDEPQEEGIELGRSAKILIYGVNIATVIKKQKSNDRIKKESAKITVKYSAPLTGFRKNHPLRFSVFSDHTIERLPGFSI